MPGQLADARPRGRRAAAAAAAQPALAAQGAATPRPDLRRCAACPGSRRSPRSSRRAARTVPRTRRRRRARRAPPQGADHPAEPARRPAPPRRAVTRNHSTTSSGSRTTSASPSTTSCGDLRRRAALVARAPAASCPDEPLVAMVPVSVRTPRAARHVRQPRRRRCSRRSPPHLERPAGAAPCRPRGDALAKQRHKAVPANFAQDAFQLIPAALFTRAARVAQPSPCAIPARRWSTRVISNVPGSPTPLYLAGARWRRSTRSPA